MTTVEITRFRTHPGRSADVEAARPAMVASFRDDVAGFIRADLVQMGEDEWIDFIVWESPEAYETSRAHASTTSAAAAFFDLITELISQESGTLAY
jgi:quinol monooxygenase YgiN